VDIHFGEGGSDSKLFVVDLAKAYKKYAINKGFSYVLLTEDEGHIIAQISGTNVYKAFQNESGKHVVQRVPPTERDAPQGKPWGFGRFQFTQA